MTIVSEKLVDDNFKVINKITGARNEDEKLIELDTLKGSTNESEISIANAYYEVEGTGTVKLQFDNEEELNILNDYELCDFLLNPTLSAGLIDTVRMYD